MRVYLDTNVLVSAVATRGLCADLLQAVLAEHRLLVGERALGELRRILLEKLGVPTDMADGMEQLLRREADVVARPVPVHVKIADPDDLVILGEAVAAEADLLVTGDGDLLDVAHEAPLPIVTPRAFWDRLRATPRP